MSQDDLRKEEVRGLFTLGLIAILVTLRYNSSLPATIQAGLLSNVPIHSILDGVILTWGLYAFFMVFAFSGDLLPDQICDMFKGIARYCLFLSVVFIIFTAGLLSVNNPFVVAIFLIVFGTYFVGKGVDRYRKRKNSGKAEQSKLSAPASSTSASFQLLMEFRERAKQET